MGSQLGTSGHNKSVNRPYQCPKVLGKPIYTNKFVHAIAQTLVLLSGINVD